MSEAVYERYKDALRRGHVAALRGRLDEALSAYAEAAAIAPERPLPYASMGGVQLRLGRLDDALASFGAALERAPRDEAALLGRAEALSRTGQRVGAAEALDLASEVQEAGGRQLDALESARRSLELAESRARRRHVRRLIDALRAGDVDDPTEAAIARATTVLEAAERPAEATAEARAEPEPAGEARPEPEPPGAPSPEPAQASSEAGRPTPAASTGPVPAAVPAPPGDALELTLAADRAVASGDAIAARDALLAAASGDAAAGFIDAALDACYRALTVAPDDADLHLALVDLYVARGWTALAARKLALLERLVGLDGDEAALARVRASAAAAFLEAGRSDGGSTAG